MLWLMAHAKLIESEDGDYMGYDLPCACPAFHVPPEIVPTEGEVVPVLVRVLPEDEDTWLAYETFIPLGDCCADAEESWEREKDSSDYLPASIDSHVCWTRRDVDDDVMVERL
jgi:hypothetical protein